MAVTSRPSAWLYGLHVRYRLKADINQLLNHLIRAQQHRRPTPRIDGFYLGFSQEPSDWHTWAAQHTLTLVDDDPPLQLQELPVQHGSEGRGSKVTRSVAV